MALAQAQVGNQWRFGFSMVPEALAVAVIGVPFADIDARINAHLLAVRLYMYKNHKKLERAAEGRVIFLEALKLIGDNLILSHSYAVTAVKDCKAALPVAQKIRNVVYHPLASTVRAELAAAEAIRNDRLRVGLDFLQLAVQLSNDASQSLDQAVWGIAGVDEGSGSETEDDFSHGQ
jgi:hypothetical protein